MEKQTFIDCINALEKQVRQDIANSELLAKVFKDSHSANLLPDNHYLTNILIRILQEEFKDNTAHSWIEYYCYELDFGSESFFLCKCRTDRPNYFKIAGGSLFFTIAPNVTRLLALVRVSNLHALSKYSISTCQ